MFEIHRGYWQVQSQRLFWRSLGKRLGYEHRDGESPGKEIPVSVDGAVGFLR